MAFALNWDEWADHDALALAELARSGQITTAELAEQANVAIERVNTDLSAVIEVFEDVVENPLKDGMIPDGVFAGVPFLMKDIGPALAGRKQEMGSLLMQGNVTSADSFLTTKIRKAGLNVIGRTATSEFAVCGSAENPQLYVSRNPWDLKYTSGGSSSGSAAIVASGALPIAHASDGGGSIRSPAGINGVIGLKPSRGVVSSAPEGSDLVSLTAVQGCITRSVRDTAAFLDHCGGAAPGEFMPFWSSEATYLETIKRDPPRLRIALSDAWGDYKADPHFTDELELTGRLFEDLGHHVLWTVPDVDFHAAHAAMTTSLIGGVSLAVDRLCKLKGHACPSVELVEPMNFKIWEAGIDMRYVERAKMQATFNQVSRAFGAFFEEWDLILTPVMAKPTHKLGTMDFITLNARDSVYDWAANLWSLYPYTPLANICGTPGISIPIALQANGLPLGIHAMARQANDALLLQLAAQVERAIGGRWNRGQGPAVHVAR